MAFCHNPLPRVDWHQHSSTVIWLHDCTQLMHDGSCKKRDFEGSDVSSTKDERLLVLWSLRDGLKGRFLIDLWAKGSRKVITIMDDKLLVSLKPMPPSSSPNVHQWQLQSLQRFLSCSHHQTCSCSTMWLTSGYKERGSDWLIEEKKCVSTSPFICNPLTSLWVFHRVQAARKLIHAYGPNLQLISSPTGACTVPAEVID